MDATAMVGIDLGTSNTVAVFRDRDGRSRPVLFDGHPVLPSGVYCDADGALHTGRDAERLAELDPARFEPNPKRRIDETSVWLGDREVRVADLLAATLRRVASELPTDVPVAYTLTYPVSWGRTRRRILLDAAAAAGLPEPDLVPEPLAAAAYFADILRAELRTGQSLMVFDFGAGTLDIAVVTLTPEGARVPAHGGLRHFGGLDLDEILLGLVRAWAQHQAPSDWAAVWADPRLRGALRREAREAKEMLSRAALAPVRLPDRDLATHVTRPEFEYAITGSLQHAVAEAGHVLRQAGVSPDDLGGVLLVGGSSRVPLLATLLHARWRVTPTVPAQPEIPVAEGALSLAQARASRLGEPVRAARNDRPEDPVPAEVSRPGARRSRRWLAAVVTAVVAAAGVGVVGYVVNDREDGHLARKPTTGLRLLSTAPWPFGESRFDEVVAIVVEDAIYMTGRVDATRRFIVQDLRSGRVRWQQTAPPGTKELIFGVSGDLVVLEARLDDQRTIVGAYGVGDGHRRWERRGRLSLRNLGAGRALFTASAPDRETPEILSLATGTTLWRGSPASQMAALSDTGDAVYLAEDGPPLPQFPLRDRVVEQPLAGNQLRIRDAATGRILAGGRVPLKGNYPGDVPPVADATALLYRQTNKSTLEIVGLSTTNLRSRWRRTMSVKSHTRDSFQVYANICAAKLLCLSLQDGAERVLVGLEPRTGRERWRVRNAQFPLVHSGTLVVANLTEGDNPLAGNVVIDATDGKVLYQRRQPSARSQARLFPQGARILVLDQSGRGADIKTTVMLLGPGKSDRTVVSEIDTPPLACQASRQHLVCVTERDETHVWQLPA